MSLFYKHFLCPPLSCAQWTGFYYSKYDASVLKFIHLSTTPLRWLFIWISLNLLLICLCICSCLVIRRCSINSAAITTIKFRTFFSPQKDISYPFSVTPHSSYFLPLWPRQALIHFMSLELPILDISYECDHAICSLFWLASFTLRHVFKVYLSIHQLADIWVVSTF